MNYSIEAPTQPESKMLPFLLGGHLPIVNNSQAIIQMQVAQPFQQQQQQQQPAQQQDTSNIQPEQVFVDQQVILQVKNFKLTLSNLSLIASPTLNFYS